MQFREVKAGQSVFILDRKETEVKSCRVVSVSASHFDNKIGSPAQMVVDVTIDTGAGKNTTYCVKDFNDAAYFDTLVITPNNDVLLRELETMKTQSEQALQMVEHHKATAEKCKALLVEYNPTYKEKQQTEARFNNLEENLDELKSLIKKVLAKNERI